MHSRIKLLGGGAIAILLAFGVSLKWLCKREPVFNGKSLTAWAQQYGSNNWGSAERDEAELAIRQTGTNAIPFLLDLMRTRESRFKKQMRAILAQKWHATLRLSDSSAEVRRIGAHGLAALGTNAPSAVPPLLHLATSHPDDDGRYIAVFALGRLGPAAEAAIPFLIQCLTNEIDIIRDDAAVGLGLIQRQPELVIPALTTFLQSAKASQHYFECFDAVQALGRFGPQAKEAAPLFIGLLNHPNPHVRMEVTNWLPRIDPEAAVKAQIR